MILSSPLDGSVCGAHVCEFVEDFAITDFIHAKGHVECIATIEKHHDGWKGQKA